MSAISITLIDLGCVGWSKTAKGRTVGEGIRIPFDSGILFDVDKHKLKPVSSSRSTIQWYGKAQPITVNDTDEGRQTNRFVELAIRANDKLKKEA